MGNSASYLLQAPCVASPNANCQRFFCSFWLRHSTGVSQELFNIFLWTQVPSFRCLRVNACCWSAPLIGCWVSTGPMRTQQASRRAGARGWFRALYKAKNWGHFVSSARSKRTQHTEKRAFEKAWKNRIKLTVPRCHPRIHAFTQGHKV